jgi:hypothetical protein
MQTTARVWPRTPFVSRADTSSQPARNSAARVSRSYLTGDMAGLRGRDGISGTVGRGVGRARLTVGPESAGLNEAAEGAWET